jgi:hypothetical protein
MLHSVATGGLDSMHTTPTDHTRSAGRVRPPRQLPAAGTDCALACKHAYHVLIALRYLGRPHHTCMHRVPHRPQGLGNAMHGHTRLAHTTLTAACTQDPAVHWRLALSVFKLQLPVLGTLISPAHNCYPAAHSHRAKGATNVGEPSTLQAPAKQTFQ